MAKKEKILITEDNFIIAMSMEEDLEEMGYDICGKVSTGEEAIQEVKKNNPDLILMDILLASEMDGIETARNIKNHADIPIIFLTGYKDEKIESEIENFDPVDYLVKPIDMNRVKETIDLIFPRNGYDHPE